MSGAQPTSSPPLATPASRHGGSAGWYRVATLRGRRIAGAAIVVGYLVAALGNYDPDRGLLAPHVMMVLAMICLIVPSFRRRNESLPAA